MWPIYIRILSLDLRGNLNFMLLYMTITFFPVYRILRNTKCSREVQKPLIALRRQKPWVVFYLSAEVAYLSVVATNVNRYSGAFKDYVHIIFITSCLVREGICRTWFLSRIFVRLFNVRTKVLTSQYEIEVSNRRRELYLFTLFIWHSDEESSSSPIQSTDKFELWESYRFSRKLNMVEGRFSKWF